MPVVWDLCSGLGGWSEAFVQAGWDVVRIENNPDLQHIPHTYELDILNYWDWIDGFPKPDMILASPPCLEFSLAYNAPRAIALREGEEYNPDMSLLHACREIIEAMSPKWWVIENVAGASRYFTEIMGPPRQIIGPFFLWGTIPFLPELQTPKKKGNVSGTHPMAANLRALIPFEMSFNLLQAWKQQRTLEDFV